MANTVEITFQVDKDSQGRTTLKQIDDQLKGIGNTTKNTGQQIDQGLSFAKAAIVYEFFKQAGQAAFAFGKEAVAAFNEVKNAELGLQSVAAFKGISGSDATGALQRIQAVKDGLISFGDASTALKNLLSRGFSLDQSITILNRFADAAAFGRQGSLSLGEAVRSASEGVKNLNSVLVDNAGVTKNISVILKERGFEMQDLDDKVKGAAAREALYAGLIAETNAQVGDAKKLTNTFAGEQAKLEAAYQKLLATIGELIANNPEVKKGLDDITKGIVNFAKSVSTEGTQANLALKETISNIGLIAQAVGGLITLYHALAAAQRAAQFVSSPVLSIISKVNEVLDKPRGTQGTTPSGTAGRNPLDVINEAIDIKAKKARDEFLKSSQELVKADNEGTKAIDEQFKKIREAADAVTELRAKLQDNPLSKFFNEADKREREFIQKFGNDVPQKIYDGFKAFSDKILELDLFKGKLSERIKIGSLSTELAKLQAGLGGSFFKDDAARRFTEQQALSKEIRDKRDAGTLTVGEQNELVKRIFDLEVSPTLSKLEQIEQQSKAQQLAIAQEFLAGAKSPLEKNFALEQILSATSDISKLTPEQIDIRAKAIQQSISISADIFKQQAQQEQIRLKATQDNTTALKAVEASLNALANESVIVKVVSDTEAASVSLGQSPFVTNTVARGNSLSEGF